MDENAKAKAGDSPPGVTITIENNTPNDITVSGSIISHGPTKTRRELCLDEALSNDSDAVLIGKLVLNMNSDAFLRHSIANSDEAPKLIEALTRAVGLVLANAEEWRARARRCPR